jgi:hypothetical protein
MAAAVALATARAYGIDIDRDAMIGDVDPRDVVDAAVLLSLVLGLGLAGLDSARAGLRTAGGVAAWTATCTEP